MLRVKLLPRVRWRTEKTAGPKSNRESARRRVTSEILRFFVSAVRKNGLETRGGQMLYVVTRRTESECLRGYKLEFSQLVCECTSERG
jgi:hypothetical protein